MLKISISSGPFNTAETGPVATVEPGQVILVEPTNARNIELRKPEDVLQPIGSRGADGSPIVGPVAVEGIRAGDWLAIDILEIWSTAPGFTRGGDEWFDEPANFIPVEEDEALFPGDIRVPLSPMVGIIGVLPADESNSPQAPGEHGGNMDIREIGTGSTVHLQAQRDEGLLFLGDVHAIMGQGEINGTGVEVDAEVIVRVRSGTDYPTGPIVETDNSWICVASDPDYAQGVRKAVANMCELMQQLHDLTYRDARTVVGTVGDVRNGCLIGMKGITPREFDHPVTLCVAMPKSVRRTGT